jgi:regulator of protease activity HflC (stomatin/prohibitin superfamily)
MAEVSKKSILIILLTIIAFFILVFRSVVTIGPEYNGRQVLFGKAVGKSFPPGIHFKNPFASIILVPYEQEGNNAN